MRKCAYCGHENEDSAAACSGCGKELGESSEPELGLIDPALSLTEVARFASLEEASLFVARLEAAGLEACIPEEYTPQTFSAVLPLQRLTVRVAAKDYEKAKAIFAEWVVASGDSDTEAESANPPPLLPSVDSEPSREGRQKPCVSCHAAIAYEETLCPKCGYTQPPLAP